MRHCAELIYCILLYIVLHGDVLSTDYCFIRKQRVKPEKNPEQTKDLFQFYGFNILDLNVSIGIGVLQGGGRDV